MTDSNSPAVHLRKPDTYSRAACGWLVGASQLALDPDEVTCRACWRTKAFAAAERSQFNVDIGAGQINAEIMRGGG